MDGEPWNAEGWARFDGVSACSFNRYAQLVERELLPKYGAVPHWAKLEVDRMGPEVASVRQNLALLVDDGQVNPTCQSGGTAQWGSTVGQVAFIHRTS